MDTKTFKAWAESFTIMAKYSDEKFPVSAEHDVISVMINHEAMSPEDAARLTELGWYIDEYGGLAKYT